MLLYLRKYVKCKINNIYCLKTSSDRATIKLHHATQFCILHSFMSLTIIKRIFEPIITFTDCYNNTSQLINKLSSPKNGFNSSDIKFYSLLISVATVVIRVDNFLINQYVSRIPFPFTSTNPRWTVLNSPNVSKSSFVSKLMWIFRAVMVETSHLLIILQSMNIEWFIYKMFITNLRSPVVSILDAVFTVSPNKQYLGILDPTTPPTTGPVWIPIRCCSVSKVLHKICI